ncbi:MAG: Bleomycin resistance protein [candidate division WS6 bacterium GW2011_GWF2_39_15]|uniref:Bleomycin resistance protein n=1 Tax=candidate division WS6 bacterium GW2011_GWF2_39_15 TaxID=1619100 RepID=A0A0G0MT94_9BACT|nr:MAG: Bleomycin resistance protein [candidate division WS6 bacterium GW2011_GWF2_39_15]
MKSTRFGIHIKVKDILESYNFYRAFDLKPVFAYGDEKWLGMLKESDSKLSTAAEKYRGVTFNVGDSLFEIADGHVAVKPEVFKLDITSSKVSAMIDVDCVDEVVEICKANSFEVAVDPVEYPWGTREVVIRDPDGFILVFREFIKKNV